MSLTAFDQDCYQIPVETGQETAVLSRQQQVFVARRQAEPKWLAETNAKLDNLAALQENWDSYGASPIDPRSIANAQQLIFNLGMFVGVDVPAIGATPDGHVGFSWDEGTWSLDAEVLPDGRIEYVYLDERDSANDRETTTRRWADLLELLTQLPESP